MPGATKRVTLMLTEETAELLAVLTRSEAMGGSSTVGEVVSHLVHLAADGVRRPGSWERQWLEPAFGLDWTEHLEPPIPPGFQRPKAVR